MFTNDIPLIGDAASTRTYSLVSIAGGSSLRSNPLTGAALPETLAIKHTSTTKQKQTSDRHLVRLDLAKADALTGEVVNGAVYLVIEAPRTVITAAQLKDMVTQLKNFLTPGVVSQLLNNEP